MTSQTIDPTALHLALSRPTRCRKVDRRLRRLCTAVARALQRPIPHTRRKHVCRLSPTETVISNP